MSMLNAHEKRNKSMQSYINMESGHYQNNLKFILRCLHYLSVPLGMGAIVSVDSVGYDFKKDSVNIIYTTVLVVLNIFSIIKRQRIENDDTSSTATILEIINDVNTVVVSFLMLNTYRMNKPFTKILIFFSDVEKSFETLKIKKIGYFKRGLIIIFTFIPLLTSLVLIKIYSSVLSLDFLSWEALNASCTIGVPFCICYHVIFLIRTNSIIVDRMKDMLLSIRDGTTWDYYNRSPLDIIFIISKIHHNIFVCSLHMADLFSSSFFCLNIVYFLIVVLTAELTYENVAKASDLAPMAGIIIYLVLIPVMLWILQSKVKCLSTILGECEICYTDLSMSIAQISQSITLVIFIFLLANDFKE